MELNSCCNGLSSLSSSSHNSMKNNIPSTIITSSFVKFRGSSKLLHTRLSATKIKAVGKIQENDPSAESNSTATPTSQQPPQVNFAFVSVSCTTNCIACMKTIYINCDFVCLFIYIVCFASWWEHGRTVSDGYGRSEIKEHNVGC